MTEMDYKSVLIIKFNNLKFTYLFERDNILQILFSNYFAIINT